MEPRISASVSVRYTRQIECLHTEILEKIHQQYSFNRETHPDLTSDTSLLTLWVGAFEVAIQDEIAKNYYLPAYIYQYSRKREEDKIIISFEYRSSEVKEETAHYIEEKILGFYRFAFQDLFGGYTPTFWARIQKTNPSKEIQP